MRYLLKLSYNGTGFCGWQIQDHSPSVQQTLQEALSKLLGTPVEVIGAGRTDSGVNAIGYTASFDSAAIPDADRFLYKINAILPRSIKIQEICPVSDGFHARFDASSREYTYFLHTVKDPFIENFSLFHPYPLDFEAMNEAATLLKGTHDFRCFEKKGSDNKTSICTVYHAGWFPYTPSHVSLMGFGQEYEKQCWWYFRIEADRFLRNMVRAVVGTLLDVGRGKRDIGAFSSLMDRGTRCDAGESVPGNALFLSGVKYGKF